MTTGSKGEDELLGTQVPCSVREKAAVVGRDARLVLRDDRDSNSAFMGGEKAVRVWPWPWL